MTSVRLLHPRLSTRELQALQNGVGGLTKKEHMHTITFDFGLDEYKFLQEIKGGQCIDALDCSRPSMPYPSHKQRLWPSYIRIVRTPQKSPVAS